MNYNLDFEFTTDIVQKTTFIPRTQLLTLRVKTNSQNIQNIRIVLNKKEYYMLKSEGAFTIQLYNNTAKEGKNEVFFIVEKRDGKEITTSSFELNFYKANIIQNEYDEITFLLATINKMINNLRSKYDN